MIVSVVNLVPLLMVNYLIVSDKSVKHSWIGYTFLEIYILYLINYG
jgi:cytochrome b